MTTTTDSSKPMPHESRTGFKHYQWTYNWEGSTLIYSDCVECHNLWHQYSCATTIHIQLDNKLRFAALQNDLNLIEPLTRETENAEKTRSDLRESIRKHEALHRFRQTAHG